MGLLKIFAGLIGFVLTLGGVGAFFWSVWLFIAYLSYNPSGPHLAGAPRQSPPEIWSALGLFVGAGVAIYLGTQLGLFAKGDFD